MDFKLNRTGSVWNRPERIGINENWDKIAKIITDRGLEILSEEWFMKYLETSGIKHREEVSTFADLPSNDSLNTVRGVAEDNKIYIKKENGWVSFQSIDISKINDLDNKMNEVQFYARDYGVVADGISDDTVALQNTIIAADGRPIIIPNGKLKITSEITYDGNLILRGSGGTSKLDFSNGGSFNLQKTLLNLPVLSANIRKGTSTVNFSESHGLSEGDVFIIYNPTDYSWSPHREYYRDGCMFKVDRVTSNNQVKIFGVSPDTYESTAIRAFKIRGNGITLENFEIIPNSETNIQVMIDGHQNVNITNIDVVSGSMYTAIEIHRCFGVNVDLLRAEVFSGDAYPLSISNSQKVTISQSPLFSARHSLALGGRSGNGCVPTRDVLIDHCILMNRSESGVGSSDIHGNCENVRYSNCIMNTGANMAGKNVKYSNCTIFGRDPDYFVDGNVIFGSEVVGGTYEIEDCRLITTGDGKAFGVINLALLNLAEDINISVKNVTIENTTAGSEARLIQLPIGNDGQLKHNVNIMLSGIEIKNKVSSLLLISGLNNLTSGSSIVIDNVNTDRFDSFIVASNTNNYNTKMRLPVMTGKINVNVSAAGKVQLSPVTNFKSVLPKEPNMQLTLQNSIDLSAIVGLFTLSRNNFRPVIRPLKPDGFEIEDNTIIHWSAHINDF